MPWQLFGCHTSCKKLSLLTFMLFGLISQNPEALAVPGLTPFRQSNLPEHVSMQATQQNAASLCTPRNAVGFQQSACSECVPATIPGVTNSTRTGKGCGLLNASQYHHKVTLAMNMTKMNMAKVKQMKQRKCHVSKMIKVEMTILKPR